MVPIAREVFWGPMAYAMIGGILAGTVLTLIFLPALYVAAYRIKAPPRVAAAPHPRVELGMQKFAARAVGKTQ